MAFDHSAFSTLLGHACGMIEQFEKNQSVASTGFLARYAAYQAAVDGYQSDELAKSVRGYRGNLSSVAGLARSLLEPLFLAYLNEVVGKPATRIDDAAFDDVIQHFITSNYTVKRRAFTRGAVALGGGNVGSGTVYRLLTDDRGNAIESSDPGVVEVKCTRMLGEGIERYRSQFSIRHQAPSDDLLDRRVSPRSTASTLTEMYPSEELVLNPSFDQGVAGTLSAAPTGWTMSTGTPANNALDGTNYHRQDGRGVTPLAFRANETLVIEQALTTTGKRFSWDRPVFAALAYNRQVGSYVGDLSFDVGAQQTTVALAAQTGWNWLVKAMDVNCWLRAFKEDDPKIHINVTRSSGYLLLDTFICRTMSRFDGGWYPVLGNVDDFHRDDVATFTDTIATDTVIQKCVHYAFGRHLPHAVASTVADPTIG